MDANQYKEIDGGTFRFGIVRARFNEEITGNLLAACQKKFLDAGVKEENIVVVEVPGSIEVPYALSELAENGKFDALIGIGAVIKGATPHFDYISKTVTDAFVSLSIKHRVPIMAGVITCLNKEQAIERSGDGPLNRGVEAAHVALEMAAIRKDQGWK